MVDKSECVLKLKNDSRCVKICAGRKKLMLYKNISIEMENNDSNICCTVKYFSESVR